jgi:hypothetical protein
VRHSTWCVEGLLLSLLYGVFRTVHVFTGDLHMLQELTTKMVSDGTYLLWDLLIFHVYRR